MILTAERTNAAVPKKYPIAWDIFHITQASEFGEEDNFE